MIEVITKEFQGPMDLLLSLIEKEKLEIEKIEISDITEKYLLELEKIKDRSTEDLTGFITMASTLMLIKSNKLLPKNEYIIEEDEISEEELKRRLAEYKKYREVVKYLKEYEEKATYGISKWQEDIELFMGVETEVIVADKYILLQAMVDVLTKNQSLFETKNSDIIQPEVFQVEKYIEDIQFEMQADKKYTLRDFIVRDGSKAEIITIFLSLLELVKSKIIRIRQDSKEICVRLR